MSINKEDKDNKLKIEKKNNSTSNNTSSIPSLDKSIQKIKKITSHDFNLKDIHSQQIIRYKDKYDNRLFYRIRYNYESMGKGKEFQVLENRRLEVSLILGVLIPNQNNKLRM